MSTPIVVFVRGWGGKIFDSTGGADLLIRRIAALNVDVLDCQWDRAADAVAQLLGRKQTPQMLVGVSCGANVLAWIADELRKHNSNVDYAAWIQPSMWCVSGWMPPIPINVKESFVIYGSCAKTLGFGCYKPPLLKMPILTPPDTTLYDGKKRTGNYGATVVSWRFVDDLHPADFDVRGVQDPILHDIARVGKSQADVKAMMKYLSK